MHSKDLNSKLGGRQRNTQKITARGGVLCGPLLHMGTSKNQLSREFVLKLELMRE